MENPSAPPHWNMPVLTRLGTWFLKRSGWIIENTFPPLAKSTVIVAPHSSNLDFFVGLATAWALDVRPSFVAKHTLFRWPLGPIMRWLGGIPVNRNRSVGFVEKTASLVSDADRIMLVIAPEGTRKSVERWRTGFYHISRAAGVPIVPAYIDWGRRRVGFGTAFEHTDDSNADIEKLQCFYEGFKGRHE